MVYSLSIDGFEEQNIEAHVHDLTGAKLLVNEKSPQKGKKIGEMVLRRDDGNEVIAKWKPYFLNLDIPRLEVDGKIIRLVDPLEWYQWAWSALTLLVIFGGGFIGAFIGLIGFNINVKLFRSKLNNGLKYLLTLIISIFVFAIYFGIAFIIVG